MLNERLLIRIGLDAAKFAPGVDCLVSPDLEAESCTSKASVVSECGDPAPALILEELEIEKGPPSPGKAAEDPLPAALVLEDVKEGDVRVLEREVFVGELFEPNDDVVSWGIDPGAFWDERESDTVGLWGMVSTRSLRWGQLGQLGTDAPYSASSKIRCLLRSTRTS